MKKKDVKIIDRKGLNEWHSLLSKWVELTNKYCEHFDGIDAPYYYNERASISVLSGAAWKIGWLSLEEFQQQKRTRRKWLGRADLYVSSENNEYYVEAKYKRVSLQSSKGISVIAKEAIENALEDSKATRRGSGVNTIAVAFIPVFISAKQLGNLNDSLIEKVIEEMKTPDFHALAWTFPESMSRSQQGEEYVYPGTFLAAVNWKFWK